MSASVFSRYNRRHMKKPVRLFLLWILIIAIPLQGFAAASMLMCGSQHHMNPSHPMQQHASPSNQRVMHDEMHHDMLSDQVNNTVSNAASNNSHSHHSSDTNLSVKHKCSACAACCVGAVILSDAIKPQVNAAASECIAFQTISHVGFITNGPERPPRFFA
ncbi:hypothetical protein AAKU61_001567 [Undibacterium sp. GrIS 1.2]